MKPNFVLLIVVMLSAVLFAGCLSAQFSKSSQNASLSPATLQNNTTAQHQTITQDTTPSAQQKTDIELVTDYIKAHPQKQFGEQASRVILVSVSETTARMQYRVSTVDPHQESTYFAGVLFIVFPDIKNVSIEGFNIGNQVIEKSKVYPARDAYNFDLYATWFASYKSETECTTDLDCNDNNNCTKDMCFDGKCSNPKIVTSECQV